MADQEPTFDVLLSREIDRVTAQIEAAEAAGDQATAAAFRAVLRDLEESIPDREP